MEQKEQCAEFVIHVAAFITEFVAQYQKPKFSQNISKMLKFFPLQVPLSSHL